MNKENERPGEISEELLTNEMASAVPEREIQLSPNAFRGCMEVNNRQAAEDSMRSIADAEKQYVPPVSQNQKQPASLTARQIRHRRWVQQGLEHDKAQKEMIRKHVGKLWFAVGLGLLWALITYTPGWVWVILGLIVGLVLVWDLLLFAVRSLGRAWRNE